jgi:hypothetical protein
MSDHVHTRTFPNYLSVRCFRKKMLILSLTSLAFHLETGSSAPPHILDSLNDGVEFGEFLRFLLTRIGNMLKAFLGIDIFPATHLAFPLLNAGSVSDGVVD